MTNASHRAALRYYRGSKAAAGTCDASPHALITMLFDGITERMGQGVSQIAHKDIVGKVRSVNSAMGLISYLRSILDHKSGGEIAQRLDALYDYMLRRLMLANAKNDPAGLREVAQLVNTIKSGWEQVPVTLRQ